MHHLPLNPGEQIVWRIPSGNLENCHLRQFRFSREDHNPKAVRNGSGWSLTRQQKPGRVGLAQTALPRHSSGRLRGISAAHAPSNYAPQPTFAMELLYWQWLGKIFNCCSWYRLSGFSIHTWSSPKCYKSTNKTFLEGRGFLGDCYADKDYRSKTKDVEAFQYEGHDLRGHCCNAVYNPLFKVLPFIRCLQYPRGIL